MTFDDVPSRLRAGISSQEFAENARLYGEEVGFSADEAEAANGVRNERIRAMIETEGTKL